MNKTLKLVLMIVSIIGLLFWTACCFLGMLYAFDGRLEIAIPLTLLLAVALFLSYLLMLKTQDKNATQGNRDRAKTLGVVMIAVYAVATLVSAFYINHLVKVENEYKKETKDNATLAIKELETEFGDAETAGSYEHYIYNTAIPTFETQLNLNMTANDSTDLELLEKWLLGIDQFASSGSFSELREAVEKETKKMKNAVKKWNVFNSVSVLRQLKELIENKPKQEEQLKAWVKSREKEEYPFLHDEPYEFSPEVDCTHLLDQVTHSSFKVSLVAILIMLALQVVILLGYLLGIKTGGKNDKIVTSDTGSTRSWPSR